MPSARSTGSSSRMMRSSRCPHCKNKLPDGYRIHPECVDEWFKAQAAKKKAQAERAAAKKRKMDRATDRARRRALETVRSVMPTAQRWFNKFIRLRDRDQPCISCGKPPGGNGFHEGRDAGHYRSVGSASHLRFNEDNVAAQCVKCNQYGAGRAVDYRLGLVARIGLSRVEALEASNEPHKWTLEELRGIVETYKAKCKELEKGQ
jgi:hypothetical protein